MKRNQKRDTEGFRLLVVIIKTWEDEQAFPESPQLRKLPALGTRQSRSGRWAAHRPILAGSCAAGTGWRLREPFWGSGTGGAVGRRARAPGLRPPLPLFSAFPR